MIEGVVYILVCVQHCLMCPAITLHNEGEIEEAPPVTGTAICCVPPNGSDVTGSEIKHAVREVTTDAALIQSADHDWSKATQIPHAKVIRNGDPFPAGCRKHIGKVLTSSGKYAKTYAELIKDYETACRHEPKLPSDFEMATLIALKDVTDG